MQVMMPAINIADVPEARRIERELVREMRAARMSAGDGAVAADDLSVFRADGSALALRRYMPARRRRRRVGWPALLFVHGGSFVTGGLHSEDDRCEAYADGAECAVFAVDYRLAPEHPFPAAIEDALTAYRWLLASGIDPALIAVAGDSAGGGLALGALVALRDAGEPMPAAAVLLSPWTDLALTGESLRTRAAADVMIKPKGMPETAALYLVGADPRHPCASPLYADLRELPPLLIHVGDAEVILDDSTRLAARASEAGVEVSLEVWDEMPHVFPAFAGLLPEADQAIERIGVWLDQRYPAGRSPAGG